ncbi:MAG: diguanylate cyclase [Candidatus Rokuibacteriota bacterium]
MAAGSRDITRRLQQLIEIGIALTSERDLSVLLGRIVAEARRFTGAEAGTLFLREGAELKFMVVQNDALESRLGAREMRARMQAERVPLDRPSLAGWVATHGEAINLDDAYAIPGDLGYKFEPVLDEKLGYRTHSVLVVPLKDPSNEVLGVLQLINALDEEGRTVPFPAADEDLVRSLASQAAVAVRNALLEELSFKDPLTEAYNRRYFALRVEEEAKRHERFGDPVSLVLLDVDHFKNVNDRFGHAAGDTVLRALTQILMTNSRSFSIVTRYGGDEFAVLLVNTPKAGAVKYATRIKSLIERHPFASGRVTVSVGVASLPEDVTESGELAPAADRALYAAKRLGRNAIEIA